MTKDKLIRYNLISQDTCNLCNHEKEEKDHLFFKCEFCHALWRRITNLCNGRWMQQTWKEYIANCVRVWKANNLRNILSKLSLGVTLY